MNTERPHHPYSCSQLSSLRACPSYEGLQNETPHFRTVAGTAIHAVIESGKDDAALSDEDIDLAVFCMNFYAERKQAIGPGAVELQEIYLSVDDTDSTAGYVDAALINSSGDYAEILDWKAGRWAVPPADANPQIQAYTLGLFRAYPNIKVIKVFIVQPAIDYITEATYRREAIPELHAEIWAIVARAKAAREAGDFSTARAFYPNCNFCRHVGRCPAVERLVGPVGAKFAPLMIPADVSPHTIHDPTQVKEAWQLASVVEAWAQAFRQHITNRVLTGQSPPPPGYKLVSREGNREIVDPVKYRNAALRRLTAEQYESTLKPSLTAVEKMISLGAPRGEKTAAVEKFAEELEQEGAVARGESVAFLKAVPQKPTDTNQTE